MKQPNQSAKQEREARLEIVSRLYKRGMAITNIRLEVMKKLNLPTYARSTTKKDIKILLDRWREDNNANIGSAIELELARIDDTIAELWSQWEQSKKKFGIGDPRYIAEIRQQLVERRKLLGLYAPERREVKGDVTVLRSPCDMTTEEIEAEIKSLKLDEEG